MWSEQGRNIVRVWRGLRNQTNNWQDISNPDGEVRNKEWAKIFDKLFNSRPTALYSFLADRNPQFIREASPLEEAYVAAITRVQNGEIKSAQELIDSISEDTGIPSADVKALILSEYSNILTVVENELLPSPWQSNCSLLFLPARI